MSTYLNLKRSFENEGKVTSTIIELLSQTWGNMQKAEVLKKNIKEKYPNVTEKQIDFLIVAKGIIDGRVRPINEMAQLFGMTLVSAKKFYNKIPKEVVELIK